VRADRPTAAVALYGPHCHLPPPSYRLLFDTEGLKLNHGGSISGLWLKYPTAAYIIERAPQLTQPQHFPHPTNPCHHPHHPFPTGGCSSFETPKRVRAFSFLLVSSHHHPSMNFFYFLLLLVVLSAYSESPQHAKSPDSFNPTVVTACSNSSSAQLGILAPGLPQNEVYIELPSLIMRYIKPPRLIMRYMFTQPHNEVYKTTLPHNEVYEIVLPQIEVVSNYLPQPEMNNTDLSQMGCSKLQLLIEFAGILQHVLKMYTWSLSENQASIQFKCRLIGLYLKQSLFRKHDFAVCVYKSIMTIRTCVLALELFFQIPEIILIHKSEKNTLRNQTRFQFLWWWKSSHIFI
jgi:hypothetical protein